MTDQVCRSCEAPVTWAITKNGKSMPLDRDPVEGGNVRLTGQTVIGHTGREGPECEVIGAGTFTEDELAANEPRYVSHFATCPKASSHRR